MPARQAKSFLGRVYLGRDENGVQQFHYVGRFATRRDRDNAVALARATRPWETVEEPAGPTVDEWAERFLKRMESGALLTSQGRPFKDSSIDAARTGLVAFRKQFGDRDPASITRVEAEDWAATTAPSNLPRVITFMNDLRRAEIIDRNRFEGLSRRSPGRAGDRPPTEPEMLQLTAACSALGDYGPIMRAMFTVAAYTLIRPGELMALTWEDIDLTANRIEVSKRFYKGRVDLPKSNKPRIVALTPPARRALLALAETRGYNQAGRVFPSKTGGQLTAPLLTGYWQQVRAGAGLDFTFYLATKHYGCRYMKVDLGLPDAVIAAQAGWSEAAVTKMVATYGHAVDERRLGEIDAAFAAAEANSDTDRDTAPA